MNETLEQTAARYIAEVCKAHGITHVFFVETILRRVLIEMERMGIERVMAHSEKAAAYMADGYARVKGGPGLCMAQSVGAANLAAGLQDPFLALSPVVALTGRKPALAQHRHAYQEILHQSMFEAVTKFTATVETPEQVPFLVPQAFREAVAGAPGPTHLDVTGYAGQDIESAPCRVEPLPPSRFAHLPPFRPQPDPRDVQEAVRILQAAERPVIVAGGGATASSAGPEIVELAELASIPVATSLNGKGIIPENHPLSVGVVGSYSRWCANRVVAEAGLVLYVGSHTGDQVTNGWAVPPLDTQVIHIDLDGTEIGRSYRNSFGVVGDARASLQKLIDALEPRQERSQWVQRAQSLVQAWREEYEPFLNSEARPIRPERLCREIARQFPADGILVVDTGFSGIWTGTMIELTQPDQRYVRAAGSLGWSLPASLGAKCAAPDRPVICFTGDGGFWYHLTELETARRRGIHTVTVINNNGCFGQCQPGVHRAYGDREGKREELLNFRDVSFADLARDMDCLGIRVEEPGQIVAALRQALGADRPAVVEVITDPEALAPDPWAPS